MKPQLDRAHRLAPISLGVLTLGSVFVLLMWDIRPKLSDWIGIEVKLMYDVVVPLGSVRRNPRVASVRAAWGIGSNCHSKTSG